MKLLIGKERKGRIPMCPFTLEMPAMPRAGPELQLGAGIAIRISHMGGRNPVSGVITIAT